MKKPKAMYISVYGDAETTVPPGAHLCGSRLTKTGRPCRISVWDSRRSRWCRWHYGPERARAHELAAQQAKEDADGSEADGGEPFARAGGAVGGANSADGGRAGGGARDAKAEQGDGGAAERAIVDKGAR